MSEPICVAPTADICGEGAVWHAAENSLYWTDINRFLIHRFDAATQNVKTWFFAEPVTALILTNAPDTLAVVLGSRLILWQPSTDARRDYAFTLSGWPKVRCNDARADPRGSLWIGSMWNNVQPDGSPGRLENGHGALYRIDSDLTVTEFKKGLGIANTLAWNPQRTAFYFADSMANVIYQYDYDAATGEIENERPFFRDFPRGAPDGSAMDVEGFLWNCRYGGGCIVRVAPNGVIDRVVEMPTPNVTTCTFGGPALRTLYITTAAAGAKPGDRFAGGLFTLQTETPGQPENQFLLPNAGHEARP
jgi:sugar lactone lactonase YvrE